MKEKGKGVSLRTLNLLMIIAAVIISGLMFFFTFRFTAGYKRLNVAAEQHIELRKAASELMDASDFLTEKVQRFTVLGDISYLNEYFEEAFEAKHREEAITTMSRVTDANAALLKLQAAMNGSLELMNREYYAMRLVIEAKGFTDYPEVLKDVALSGEDAALSTDEKMHRAAEMVHDDEYYHQKDVIRENMKASLNELEQNANDSDASALEAFGHEMAIFRIVILIQIIGVFALVFMTSRLGIHPVLNAVDRIKQDKQIPEVGANEFRYLAQTYNKMYKVYKRSVEHLNYKASHDELTGAYNRAGYELLISGIDLSSTYMMMFDIDNFKGINDNYGHVTGDKALAKLVKILNSNFRADDYVCRVGGDEFVVFMAHSTEMQRDLIVSKIAQITKELADTSDGMPLISVSVGITHGTEAADADDLFRKADNAMYRAKQNGKNTYCFDSE